MNSREKLLIACKKVLLDEGQSSLTIRYVAKIAGVNQGLVHHYFGAKENMVLELIDYETTQALEKVKSYMKQSGTKKLPIDFLIKTDLGKFMIEIIYLSQHMPGIINKVREIIIDRRDFFGKMFGIESKSDRILMQVCILGSIILGCVDPEINTPEVIQNVQEKILNLASKES